MRLIVEICWAITAFIAAISGLAIFAVLLLPPLQIIATAAVALTTMAVAFVFTRAMESLMHLTAASSSVRPVRRPVLPDPAFLPLPN